MNHKVEPNKNNGSRHGPSSRLREDARPRLRRICQIQDNALPLDGWIMRASAHDASLPDRPVPIPASACHRASMGPRDTGKQGCAHASVVHVEPEAVVLQRHSLLKLMKVALALMLALAYACGDGDSSDADRDDAEGSADAGADAAPGSNLPTTGPPPSQDASGGGGFAPPDHSSVRLPDYCWLGAIAECNPVSGFGCASAEGQTCDISRTDDGDVGLLCLDGPNTATVGGACSNSAGPFCGLGTHCDPVTETCLPFCCHAIDCPPSTRCTPIESRAGTLGLCRVTEQRPPPQSCAGPNQHCHVDNDCCSFNCLNGHCN